MKIALPGNTDVLKISNDPILLNRMKGVHVDFDGKRVLYQAWVSTNDHNKLKPPMKNVIATDSFDIRLDGTFTSDNSVHSCHVHRAVYHAAKHMYLVEFTCGLNIESNIKPTTIQKGMSNDSSVDIAVKDIADDSRGSFIEFD